MCRSSDYPPYERDNEMREISFGPISNPDGTPTETTLEIMGISAKIGDNVRWYPGNSDYPSNVKIIGMTPTGFEVNYMVEPTDKNWFIPFSEAGKKLSPEEIVTAPNNYSINEIKAMANEVYSVEENIEDAMNLLEDNLNVFEWEIAYDYLCKRHPNDPSLE